MIAVIGFVRLGIWQLERHGEKTDLRDAVAAGQALPPVPIGEAPEGSFRRVRVTGEYDPALQALVLRSHDGASGYHVLTPLLADGIAVLVDRGWIPLDEPPPSPPGNPVTIEGVLWPAEEGSSVPGELPAVVRRIDPEIQQAFAGYPLRADYLILTGGRTAEHPIPAEAPGIGLGPHLGYAGQWFLFALVVLAGYPLLLRKAGGSSAG